MHRLWRALSPTPKCSFKWPLLLFAALLTPLAVCFSPRANAQEGRRPAPGTVIIPSSNHIGAADRGQRAHTNLRLVVPPDLEPSEAPPYLGYGYETPASLACIYRVVQPIRGCNPNSTTNTPDGGSETIAIVDAYDDPNISADLAVFSQQFGIPLAAGQFKVVYANGTKPPTDPSGGWESEEALDVEYVHAMAPHAKIYLVEAASNYLSDLFNAVYVAKHLVQCGHASACPSGSKGKGEVSMSWGASEFPTESNYDVTFTGANVVFLASTGDGLGVQYPSASPNVIGVGGTTDSRSLSTGDLIQQISWSEAGGGLSFYEPTPSYQAVLPASITQGSRAVPDISADANPNTGVWVYDSYPFDGVVYDWGIVGGTSVAVQVAAGILNAASTASGHFATSTAAELTRIYSEYPNSGTYHADFWDITYGACNFYSGSFSGGGYDLCTGLGTPKGLMGK
jgi:kumamolisin